MIYVLRAHFLIRGTPPKSVDAQLPDAMCNVDKVYGFPRTIEKICAVFAEVRA